MNQSMEVEGPVSPVNSVLGCYPADGWGGGEAPSSLWQGH